MNIYQMKYSGADDDDAAKSMVKGFGDSVTPVTLPKTLGSSEEEKLETYSPFRNSEVVFPEFEESPFTLKSFLSMSYDTREMNLSYRLGIIQGSECDNIGEFCKTIDSTLAFIKSQMRNVGIVDLEGKLNSPYTQGVTVDHNWNAPNKILDMTGDYKAREAMKSITNLTAFASLSPTEANKFISLATHLYNANKKNTKMLVYNASGVVAYLACLFMSLVKVDVLIINPSYNYCKEEIFIGQLQNLEFEYNTIPSLSTVKDNLPKESLDVICSTSYTAEKAVLDKFHKEMVVGTDTAYKVVFAKTTQSELEAMLRFSYKATYDYLGAKMGDMYTILPVTYSILRGNYETNERKLKASYKNLFKNSQLIYIDGLSAEEMETFKDSMSRLKDEEDTFNFNTKALLDNEDAAVDEFEKALVTLRSMQPQVASFVIQQYKALLQSKAILVNSEEELYKVARELFCVYTALPQEIYTFLISRTWTSVPPTVLFYVDDIMVSSKYIDTVVEFLTCIAFLGINVVIIDPRHDLNIENMVNSNILTTVIGEKVSDKFRYTYKTSVFGW